MIATILLAAAALDLHLVCDGSGVQGSATTAQSYAYDSDGNRQSTLTTIPTERQFGDQVRIDLTGETGRIRIPQAMLPPIRGGDQGWFTLKNVSASDSDITATATINFLNKVRVRLDRVTGSLSFTTLKGQFLGRCIRFDPATAGRAF